jgi:hypothetical protein
MFQGHSANLVMVFWAPHFFSLLLTTGPKSSKTITYPSKPEAIIDARNKKPGDRDSYPPLLIYSARKFFEKSVLSIKCEEDCPCHTMAKKPGECDCGKEMLEVKVTKVEDGKAYLQAQGWEKPRAFLTVGKYACACGHDCKCTTIS